MVLLKAHVRAHSRKTKSGAASTVRAHEDKRMEAETPPKKVRAKYPQKGKFHYTSTGERKHPVRMHSHDTVKRLQDRELAAHLREHKKWLAEVRAGGDEAQISKHEQYVTMLGDMLKRRKASQEKKTKRPKLEPGQGLIGPSLGSMGVTGLEPAIARSKARPDLHVVGTSGAVRELLRRIARAPINYPKTFKEGPEEARTLSDRNAAFDRYETLCAAVLKRRKADAEEVSEAKKKLKAGTHDEKLKAALALNDHGLLKG